MRWKKELIGASLTLAVTVIAGLILWLITQEPSSDKRELLYYQLDKPVGFSGREQKFSIGTFSFGNVGDLAARTVSATLSSRGATILEANISSSSGPLPKQSIRNDGHTVMVAVPSLLPGDRISVSYLLDSPAVVSLDIRSDATKARPLSSVAAARPDTPRSKLNQFFERYWPILFLASFVPIWLFRKERKQSKKADRYRPENRNNNAFVLMHTGFPDDAKALLRQSIDLGKDGSFAMSNYAGACALTGDDAEAAKYIEAADFLAESEHERAIVDLNRAIIAYRSGNKQEALSQIRSAAYKSDDEMKYYLKHSKVLKGMCDWNPELRAAIERKPAVPA